MADESTRRCAECGGAMSPIVIMDRVGRQFASGGSIQELAYRQPDDSRSFWTGQYPTAGTVRAFLCGDCGRIALYGEAPDS
jgi:hypothetical protein